jgi:aspartate-semialdehyde dehydrogenase
VPEINAHLCEDYTGIIANPNCSTIQIVLVLNVLNQYKAIKKVVITTMQSVSGSGYNGINEMQDQRDGKQRNEIYPHVIDQNVIPQIGAFGEDGFSEEETKMTNETRKILGIPDINLVATTVRVPVVYGHSESVYIEFYDTVNVDEIKDILRNSPSIEYHDGIYTPLDLRNSDSSHVARMRYAGDDKSILLWNVAHNVRLGAATNAVKILKKHIELNASKVKK